MSASAERDDSPQLTTMNDFWNLHEIVQAAYRALDRKEWDFIMGGSETEASLRRNRLALDSLAFRPRVLNDVARVDTSTSFLDRNFRLPVFLAPIGKQTYGGGPVAAAKAAARFGCGYMLSSVNASATIEDIARAAPDGLNVYQLYVRGDADWVKREVGRAVAAGCIAFCVTVDTPVISRRERDFANRYTSKTRRRFAGEEFQRGFDWAALAALREHCPLPLIVKGIATGEDARRAVELGVDAIYVSNHGGRQLDHARGSLDDLREVVEAVSGRARLIVDGSIYRGTDIAKAIATGAHMVGIGKLHCLALAAAGESGVEQMLELLEDEMEICLALLGASKLARIDRSYVERSVAPGLHSGLATAFPLLNLPTHEY